MKNRLNNQYIRWGLTAFLVIAAAICFYYVVFHISDLLDNFTAVFDILMPIMCGLITAYLLTPLLNFIENNGLIPLCGLMKIKDCPGRKKVIRILGILITAVLFFSLIYILVALLLSQIIPSIEKIIANFDLYVSNITKWLDDLLANNPDLKDYIYNLIDKYSNDLELWFNNTVLTTTGELIKTVSTSIIGVLEGFWDFIVGFIISIYLLSSKETFAGQAKKIIYAVFSRDTANVVLNNLRFTHKTFVGFVGGKILDSIIIGFLCFIGTSILGTPYAALVSLVIGVTNVIPFFGPFLGAIPTIILIFVVDPIHPLNCVYFALFILALQQFDGNILGPKILGNSTGITGFWVIFSITLFGGIFGVTGMIVGVPLFAVIYAMLKSFIGSSLRKKQLPQDTASYISLSNIDENGLNQADSPKHEYFPCNGSKFYSSAEEIKTESFETKSDYAKMAKKFKKTTEKKENVKETKE